MHNQSLQYVVYVFEGHLDDDTLHYMSMPRCGVRDKVGFATDSRSRRYALQGKYKKKKLKKTSIRENMSTNLTFCAVRRANLVWTITKSIAPVWELCPRFSKTDLFLIPNALFVLYYILTFIWIISCLPTRPPHGNKIF